MRCYVTVSKSHFSISDSVQAQPEYIKKINSSRDLIHSSCVAGPADPVLCSCYLCPGQWQAPCNMVEGGPHPGTRVLWFLMPACRPWRLLWPRAWAMRESSHAQLMLWDNWMETRIRQYFFAHFPLLHLYCDIEIGLCKL